MASLVRVRDSKPLTPEQERRVAQLSQSSGPIDYTDIPPLDEAFWRRAIGNPFYPRRAMLEDVSSK